MTVNATFKAWEIAAAIFPADYIKDEESSQKAGYPIYRSARAYDCTDKFQPFYCTIADLGGRLEVIVTYADRTQKVTNINIIRAPKLEVRGRFIKDCNGYNTLYLPLKKLANWAKEG